MTDEMTWDGDWYAIESANERDWAEDELRRELCPEHVLYGLKVTAVGRRWRRDDILFRTSDGRFAQVHLTRRPEADPYFPAAQLFQTFGAWQAVPVEDR